MKIKAKHTILHDGKRYRPGDVFEIDDMEAKVLITQRFAVEAEDTAPAVASEPVAKPKKSVQQPVVEAEASGG